MDIGTPIKDWGPLDATALREAILNQDDAAWNEDEQRQRPPVPARNHQP